MRYTLKRPIQEEIKVVELEEDNGNHQVNIIVNGEVIAYFNNSMEELRINEDKIKHGHY